MFKAQFNHGIQTKWRPTEECSVLNITLLAGGNARHFICRVPHFSTVSGWGTILKDIICVTNTVKPVLYIVY
jgi:hypothetical protein